MHAAGFLAAVMALSATAFTHADDYYRQNSHRNNQRYTSYEGDRTNSKESNVSDADLTQKIQDKIGSGWMSKGYDQVTVQVKNGNVTLQGNVQTYDDKEKVEKDVRNIEGVKALNSQLKVVQPSKDKEKRQFPQDTYSTNEDDQLNKKIRDTTSKGFLWNSYEDVTLNTSKGVVTLEGMVNNLGDQQKLMTEIQKIDGVKSVKSNLRIKNR